MIAARRRIELAPLVECLYSDKIEDDAYQKTAYTPDGHSLHCEYRPCYYSPSGKADFDKLYPGPWWQPKKKEKSFPHLKAEHPIINAVYQLALDVFYRCSSGEFVRRPEAGETPGMWQAGYFKGNGYGVWVRDVAYIALFMGSVLDPEGAALSLDFVTKHGIDSAAEDSRCLPTIALWDHYLATGDISRPKACYRELKKRLEEIEYLPERRIAKARHASYIDGDGQEENGGFALSTNILYAQAYADMARLGALLGESTERTEIWRSRALEMRQGINTEFWNKTFGYYTNGPKGSDAFAKGYWENGGQSLAMWPRFGIAGKNRVKQILNNKSHAFNQYGFAELPHWDPKDFPDPMFARKVWIHTEVGEAVAMAAAGEIENLETLLFSCVRDAAINKDFMEIICFDTGIGSRYPGQNWHAMGFLAMIYFAVLGFWYNETGMGFKNGLVPSGFKNLQISPFVFKKGSYTIRVEGHGPIQKTRLDGRTVEEILSNTEGKHEIVLTTGTSAS